MKFLLYIILFSPFLVSCQEKYNHQPYDEKEKDIRMMPISQNEIVLDSIWDKRDSLSLTLG